MTAGSFDLSLDGAPRGVTSRIDRHATIAVTTAPIDDGIPNLAQLSYRGIVEGWSHGHIAGAGLLSLLGDGGGVGAANQYTAASAATWATWLSRLSSDGHLNGLTVATPVNAPATTWPTSGTVDVGYLTIDIIRQVAAVGPVEWYVTPDGRFVSGRPDSIFSARKVMISPHLAHVPSTDPWTVLPIIGGWQPGVDAQDWLNYVRGTGTTGTTPQASSNLGTEATVDAAGTNAVRRKANISTQGTTNASVLSATAQHLAGRQNPSTPYGNVTVDCDDPHRYFEPGDWLRTWDLENYAVGTIAADDLEDGVWAESVRVYGYEWAPQPGCGVYLRPNGTQEWLDLAPWIVWDKPGCSLDLGARRRTAFSD